MALSILDVNSSNTSTKIQKLVEWLKNIAQLYIVYEKSLHTQQYKFKVKGQKNNILYKYY